MSNSNHEQGASQATRTKKVDEPSLVGDDGSRLLNPEEARALRMMESENERRRVEKMRREAWERTMAERRSFKI